MAIICTMCMITKSAKLSCQHCTHRKLAWIRPAHVIETELLLMLRMLMLLLLLLQVC